MSNVENFEPFYELFMSQLALSRGTPVRDSTLRVNTRNDGMVPAQ